MSDKSLIDSYFATNPNAPTKRGDADAQRDARETLAKWLSWNPDKSIQTIMSLEATFVRQNRERFPTAHDEWKALQEAMPPPPKKAEPIPRGMYRTDTLPPNAAQILSPAERMQWSNEKLLPLRVKPVPQAEGDAAANKSQP